MYRRDAVAWAVDSGIISGLPNGMLAPSRITTRAEAAAMLQRFVSVLLIHRAVGIFFFSALHCSLSFLPFAEKPEIPWLSHWWPH